MVKEFIPGRFYKYTLNVCRSVWPNRMKVVFDGKPRRCLRIEPNDTAEFEGVEGGLWAWSSSMQYWEDCTHEIIKNSIKEILE